MSKRGIFVNQNGTWVEVLNPSVKQSGNFTDIQAGYVNVNGTWKKFFPSTGTVEFTAPGAYTFKVPPGIHSITVDATAGGGGGGGGEEVGAGGGGGGGGSGGFIQGQVVPVVPGETITINVGGSGPGAPFVGRTGSAPSGSQGGDTSLTGSQGSILVTGGFGGAGAASGDSGGGGGKIICTKLYQLGLMDYTIYAADQAFGAELVKSRPDIYNGYRAWAEIVVDWMNSQGPDMLFWSKEQIQQWATSWAEDIATPWAEEMAYKMGKKESGSITGKLITAAGVPICKVVGVWQRVFGPSRKPAGFIKGFSLIAIFVMFKIVVELGRSIEKGHGYVHTTKY